MRYAAVLLLRRACVRSAHEIVRKWTRRCGVGRLGEAARLFVSAPDAICSVNGCARERGAKKTAAETAAIVRRNRAVTVEPFGSLSTPAWFSFFYSLSVCARKPACGACGAVWGLLVLP